MTLSYSSLRESAYCAVPEELREGILFLTLHGSRAYGTATPDSDYDIRGVCIPPRKYYTGYLHRFDHLERKEPHDFALYELQKFCKLAADCNPNIIELLYVPESKWLYSTLAWRILVAHRHLFLSKKAKFTFSGYAISQLKRIVNHYHWLHALEPIKPTREEFDLPTQMKLTVSEEQVVYKLLHKGVFGDPSAIQDYLTKEQRYRAAYDRWETYTKWKANRNPYRHDLEMKYGFDVKHAQHLIRLMRMCKEILTTGEVLVERPDAEELLDIKRGKWSYQELINWAEDMDASLEELYKTSTLQKEPDRNAIDLLCQHIVVQYLF